jgi:hypothetical protein
VTAGLPRGRGGSRREPDKCTLDRPAGSNGEKAVLCGTFGALEPGALSSDELAALNSGVSGRVAVTVAVAVTRGGVEAAVAGGGGAGGVAGAAQPNSTPCASGSSSE